MDRPPEYMDALFKMYPGKWCWAFPSGIIDYENMVWHDEELPKPTKEEVTEVYEELRRKYPWEILRRERNRRLTDCDWVAIRAFTTDTPVPEEWKTYMQALRDLPTNTEDPENPVWPTIPTA